MHLCAYDVDSCTGFEDQDHSVPVRRQPRLLPVWLPCVSWTESCWRLSNIGPPARKRDLQSLGRYWQNKHTNRQQDLKTSSIELLGCLEYALLFATNRQILVFVLSLRAPTYQLALVQFGHERSVVTQLQNREAVATGSSRVTGNERQSLFSYNLNGA